MATANCNATAGDGTAYQADANWDTCHNAATAEEAPDYTGTAAQVKTRLAGSYIIQRAFIPFDTSAIPANANISAANVHVYIDYTEVSDNDGDDFITVVQTTQANTDGLVSADYDNCGDTHNATEGIDPGERKDISSTSYGQFLAIELNATGIGWIQKGGITNLGLREGHDILDHAYAGANGTENVLVFHTSEGANKPYLTVDYTEDAPVADYIRMRWTK